MNRGRRRKAQSAKPQNGRRTKLRGAQGAKRRAPRRRGLGLFLLQSLRRRNPRRRARVIASHRSKDGQLNPLNRGKGGQLALLNRSKSAPAPASRKSPDPLNASRAPSYEAPQKHPAPVAPPETRDPNALTVRALIRPDDRLRQSIEAFLLDQRSAHTRRSYAQDLRRFMKFLLLREDSQNLQHIDRSTIVAHKEFLLSEGLEHTTVDRHLATLRSFFQWLVDDGLLEKSPADSVRFLNPKRLSRTIGFSNEEVRCILGAPDVHTRTGALHHTILAILFYCGLRRSEVCALKRSNLTSEKGQPILRLRGKGDVERIVALPPPVVQALDHYLRVVRKTSGDTYLFTPIRNNRTGVANKPIDASMIYYIVRRYAKRAGIESRVSPHSCRATAISNARDHQVPDRAIQEFAGWSTPAMITRYDKRRTAAAASASLAISYEKAK